MSESTAICYKTLVDSLFDGTEYAESLLTGEQRTLIEPAALARELIDQRETRGSHAHVTLCVRPEAPEDDCVLMELLSKAQSALSAEEINQMWAATRPSIDISVWGGSSWEPKILLSGAVLFRNHHRVIGIGPYPSFSVEMANDELRERLAELFELCADEDDDAAPTVIHRDEEGVRWSRALPLKLSASGQTLIILPLQALSKPEAADYVPAHQLSEVAEHSRANCVILRVFKNRFFAFGTYRASDDADVLVEDLSIWLGDSPSAEDTSYIEVSGDYAKLTERVASSIMEYCASLDSLPLSAEGRAHVEQELRESVAGTKASDMLQFPRFFGSDPAVAPSYYGDTAPYADQMEAVSDNVVALEFRPSVVERIEELTADTLLQRVDEVLGELNVGNTKVEIKGAPLEGVFEWDDPALVAAMGALAQQLRETLEEYDDDSEESQSEVLANSDATFVVIGEWADDPEPAAIHRWMIDTSAQEPALRHVYVPAYGFSQGYYEGELDTGNADAFLTEDDLAYAGEQDDWDEEDENED